MILDARPAHAAAMAAVHAGAFPPGGEWGPPWGASWGEMAFAVQLGLPGVFGLIDPEGAVLLARVAAEEAEVLTLAVAPPARRKGLGRALLRAAMARAAAAGARRMVLEVSVANAPAAALYGTVGFREVGRRRRYYADGSDALVLAVELKPQA
jgi:[ribosomal protein S18]-alanine N-acetyltransferase